MFKEQLDKLSISAKEAVIDGTYNGLDDFKNYLHIERNVEKALEEIVHRSVNSSKPKLILISGNVGDGKSHMLAKLFQKYPTEMLQISVRNDATESNFVSKTWLDELTDFFSPFSDDNLNNSSAKTTNIVAINLGVLSKFLAEKGGSFNELNQFVLNKGILDEYSYDNNYVEESTFQFINLADFKLFSLSSDSIKSDLIRGILKKITATKEENPIYNSFISYYKDHPYKDNCVVRHNYLLLSNDEVQENITSLIVSALVKDKLILSIRDLLNFIYDIIVPFSQQNLSSEELLLNTGFSSSIFIIRNSIGYKLFEAAGRSPLFTSISSLDPLRIRNEQIDKLIFKIQTSNSPKPIFDEENVSYPPTLFSVANDEIKDQLTKYFVRTRFIEKGVTSSIFKDFIRYLFAYYSGDQITLKHLYKDVILSIQKWNGTGRKHGEVNIPIGKHQITYNVMQKIKFEPNIISKTSKQSIVDEFDYTLAVGMKVDDKYFSITLDFNLYSLIQKIKSGYSPNKKDKEDHLDFQNFVNLIIDKSTGTKDELIFEKIKGNSVERFELSLDAYGDYIFKKA